MGRLKDRMIHEDELGCSLNSDKAVCTKCIEDEELAEVVRANPTNESCSFCGKKRKEVGEFSSVVERIAEAIRLDWVKPEEELFFDRESESGWAGETLDIRDVLWQIGYEVGNEALMDEIADAFSDRQFCERDYGTLRPRERWNAGWSRFKYAVRHKRRFTFWSMTEDGNSPDHPDHLPVGQMLREIGKIVRKAKLLKVAATGSYIWRVRVHDADMKLKSHRGLRPPPLNKALQANRMSPSGVVMFYGAEDFETACIETVNLSSDKARAVTGGRFKAARDLLLLDLVQLPRIPSYFDLERRSEREAISFLPGFTKDLAAPVRRDGRQHIDYVPTQAFTEYVRFRMRGENKAPIDGIRYPSAHNGKPCVVLFCGAKECATGKATLPPDAWLLLDSKSVKTVRVRDIEALKPRAREGTS